MFPIIVKVDCDSGSVKKKKHDRPPTNLVYMGLSEKGVNYKDILSKYVYKRCKLTGGCSEGKLYLTVYANEWG